MLQVGGELLVADTVVGKNTTLTVENKAFSGILIHKTDSVTGKGIYGVTFLLYDSLHGLDLPSRVDGIAGEGLGLLHNHRPGDGDPDLAVLVGLAPGRGVL